MGVDESAFRLAGKVAAVTGAGSGIGQAVATLLARVGATVVAADIDPDRGSRTVAEIVDGGGRAVFCATDVTRRADLDRLAATAVESFGRLDIMCNLAGVPPQAKELIEVSEADLDGELAISLKAVLYGCQAAIPWLRSAGGGAIVNVSSTAIDLPAAGHGLYHLGKQAVAGLTRTLAKEVGPDGIRVNAIAPGVTLTNFSARYFTAADGTVDPELRQEWLDRMAGFSPLRLVGSADDQALLVLYLVSDAARFVTGQVIRANGGWTTP